MKKSRIQVFVLAMCCVAGPAYAGTAWPSSISKLCAASDLVVVGRVTRDSADPFATVNVNRTLKGQDAPGGYQRQSPPIYVLARRTRRSSDQRCGISVARGRDVAGSARTRWRCPLEDAFFPRSASRTRSVRQYVMRGQSCYRGGRGPHR